MHHLSALFSLSLALFASAAPHAKAQSLAGTGFAWFASGTGDTCQILGGDHGERLIFKFRSGVQYAFGSSQACPSELPLDGPTRIYRIHSSSIKPGEMTLVDQRGMGWSVRKEMPGVYKVRRTTQ